MRRALAALAVLSVAVPAHAHLEGPWCGGTAPARLSCRVAFEAERDVTLLFATGADAVAVTAHLTDGVADEQRVVCWTETCLWTFTAPRAFEAGERLTLTGQAVGSGSWLVQAVYGH